MRFSGRLHRLTPQAYCGRACVHWTMTMNRRATGWLDALLHARLREILLHASAHSETLCAVYCLMPDHGHFLVMGVSERSNSHSWARLLRRHWNTLLPAETRLQRQAYDHVLRRDERERNAFQKIAFYILENPVRKGLVRAAADWPFAGTIVPGFPSLRPSLEGFWDSFWRAHATLDSRNP